MDWSNSEDVRKYYQTKAIAWNKAHPEERKISKHRHIMKRRYGLLPYQYEIMMLCQGGSCGICGEQIENEGDLHVDHDHATNEIRGFTCRAHNLGLGKFGDSIEQLQRAIDYLGGR